MKRYLPVLVVAVAALGAFSIPLERASADDAATKRLFNSQCSSCHGVDGRGQTTAGQRAGVKDWTTTNALKSLGDADVEKVIRQGRKDQSGKEVMPPIRRASDDQVKALVSYVRTFQK